MQLGLYRKMSLYNTSCDWLSDWRGISGLIRTYAEAEWFMSPAKPFCHTKPPWTMHMFPGYQYLFYQYECLCFLCFLCHNKLPKRVWIRSSTERWKTVLAKCDKESIQSQAELEDEAVFNDLEHELVNCNVTLLSTKKDGGSELSATLFEAHPMMPNSF